MTTDDYIDVDKVNSRIHLCRWRGECKLTLKLPNPNTWTLKENKLICKSTEHKHEFQIYKLNKKIKTHKILEHDFPYTLCDLGGLEVEIILYEPLEKIILNIETKNLVFYYQPPLHPEHPTYILNEKGEIVEIRPPEVVGSYAVYYKNISNYHSSKERAEKYKTGKAFHIYRPKLIDAIGKEAWADIEILNNQLIIKIPRTFLETAVYPITVDPTFGYEQIGATSSTDTGGIKDRIRGSLYNLPENGEAQSITIYLKETGGFHPKVKCGIYKSDNTLIGVTEELTVTSFEGWKTFNFTTPPSLTSGDYALCAHSNSFAGYLYIYYDTGVEHWYKYQVYSNGYPDPFDGSKYADSRKISIYCTYTSGATVVTVTDSVSLNDVALSHKNLSIQDNVSSTETLLSHKNFLLTETLSLTDNVYRNKVFSIHENINVSDQVYRNKIIVISDEVSSLETVTVITEIIHVISDVIGVSDEIIVNKQFAISDNINVVDDIYRDKNFIVSDYISSVSDVLIDKILMLTDNVSILDELTVDKKLIVTDAVNVITSIIVDKLLKIKDTINLSTTIDVITVVVERIIKGAIWFRSKTTSLWFRSLKIKAWFRKLKSKIWFKGEKK